MPTKSPTPPPKFNIGDIVYFKDVAYRVTNRRYTVGPWKYSLVEHDVLIPRHKLVKEDLLVHGPLQVPAKFKVGDRVVYQAEVFEINSMFWHIDDKWKYNLVRYLPPLPGENPVADHMYNVLENCLKPVVSKQPAPQKPLFELTDIVVYRGEAFRITQIWYEFSTKTFRYDLQTKEPNSLGSYATCKAIAENDIQGEENFETELSDDIRIIEEKSKFKIGDFVEYNKFVCRVTMYDYNDERKEYQYEIKTPCGRHLHKRRESELKLHTAQPDDQTDTPIWDDVEGKKVEEPKPLDGRTVTNNQGGKQSFVSARFDCIPPVVLRLLAQCLGFGARKYGDTNYQNISMRDHLNHAINHINEWNRGDRSEPHLVNAMARLTFALWHAVDQNQQPDTYIHPDEKQS